VFGVSTEISQGLQTCFERLEDPRIDRKKLHSLEEILLVVLCGYVCGAESFRDFVLFGNERIEFLRQHFAYANGIASKNTFARVLGALKPQVFRAFFIQWAKGLQKGMREVIAIDGKTLRRSGDAAKGQSAIHMVSAFACQSQLVLGQYKTHEKSNEITAIPELLDLLDIRGQTITIDAAGCQKAIAKKIQEGGADYVLALKGNQGTLNEDVRLFLNAEADKPDSSAIASICEDVDAGHGRIEKRKCVVSSELDFLVQKPQWAGLKSVAMIEETRDCGGKVSVERRFFITSLAADAKTVAHAVRSHWAIENNLHWTLDVVFNEDQSRVRKDSAPENLSIIRHFVLNMLQAAKTVFKGIGPKSLRKKAAWGDATLGQILRQNF
jgi:predicted transposase YbfD/YdcC